ncbi:hypothetical protein OSB04_029352 [Centaurea solstitialis]|uniref:Uncharacterized protein n=1 Tax=Centaurea solstitialis TaxID=347529 RepID=A0AA38SUC4_9ASTR|nr:hypothetical protein OSB04_029352 [Centaurea solstitialis]
MGSWWKSSSGKILWMIIAPMVLILGFMALKKSDWGIGFVYSYPWGSSRDDTAVLEPGAGGGGGGGGAVAAAAAVVVVVVRYLSLHFHLYLLYQHHQLHLKKIWTCNNLSEI